MKELSIEEKAKRYDEALAKAAKIHRNYKGRVRAVDVVIEEVFPELKESVDERIRKVLLNDFKNNCSEYYCEGVNRDMIIAWLEKQGEQKPTDKVEPKFHEGDWVVYECWEETATLQIKNIVDETYEFTDDSTLNVVDEDTLRLWTIQDAKDGDVLCCENGWTCIFKALSNHANTFSSYCFMDSDNWFCNTGSESHTLDKAFIKAYNGEIHPATKEQRDLLFQRMKEAGYTFDFEKKELKKIEQKEDNNLTDFEVSLKHVMEEAIECGDTHNLKADADMLLRIAQKSAWSEEDERCIRDSIFYLKSAKKYFEKDDDILWNEKWFNLCIEWLESLYKMLRPQNTWKPSDEQMAQLGWIAKQNKDNMIGKELMSLYQDLKKLREE